MILRKDQLPAAPRGFRILVKPDPPVEDSSIIITPDDQKHLPNKGRIIAAGMNALDTMHDHGDRIGDEVWWGKFAGVVEAWDHIEKKGPKFDKCRRHDWVGGPPPRPRTKKWVCRKCQSTRLAEHLLVMNVDDLLTNVTLQRRAEKGIVTIKRGKLADGRTQHYIDRKDS